MAQQQVYDHPVVQREAIGRLIDGTVRSRTSARTRLRRVAYLNVVTDAVAVAVAMTVAYVVISGFGHMKPDLVTLPAACATLVVVFALFGLYSVGRVAPAEEFRRVLAATTVSWAALQWIPTSPGPSRAWLGLSWVFSLLTVLGARKLWHRWMGHQRAAGTIAYRTLVIGSNHESTQLISALLPPETGYHPIGRLETPTASVDHGSPDDEVPVYRAARGPDELRALIRDLEVDCLFVAASAVSGNEMSEIARVARLEDVEIRVSTNLPQILSSRASIHSIGTAFVVSLRPVRLSGVQAAAKRAFDLTFSIFALVLLAPVLAFIALSVKLTSRGPILFRQERVGRRGSRFHVLKFRTMVERADLLRDALLEQNEADGPLFKIRRDPRVTTVGRFLRRWSLDELPQLLNVIAGQMSLVGPRPALPCEVAMYEEWHRSRLEVAPGITGAWQVNGRSDLSFDQYVRLDLFYIENWSLSYDFYLLARTLPAMVRGSGAY
jgi:exopolysaccharide biosynthesis polyprenyl glycosylphosphotransferase